MALIDFYGNDTQDAVLYFASPLAANYSPGRNGVAGTAMFGVNGGGSMFHRLPTAIAHGFMGCSMGSNLLDGTFRPYFMIGGDGGTIGHLSLGLFNGGIQLWRGGAGGQLITSYVGAFMASTHYYIEIEWTIADTGGICKVRLNGTEVINYVGDTRSPGATNASIDTVWFGVNGGVVAYFDDWYVCDDTGPAPRNTFLGDVRILPIRATAAGASTSFTPDSGANYARVNETPYSAANYVSATAAAKDSYAMSDLSVSPAPLVHGVKAALVAKNPDGGNPSVRNLIRVGSTDYPGSSVILGANDTVTATLWANNPATSAAWTAAEVNALEVGVERV